MPTPSGTCRIRAVRLVWYAAVSKSTPVSTVLATPASTLTGSPALMVVICTCGSNPRMKGCSAVTLARASASQGRLGSAPKRPYLATRAKSVAGLLPCPRRLLKTWKLLNIWSTT